MFLDRRLQTCRRQEERRVELAKAQGEWEGEGRGGRGGGRGGGGDEVRLQRRGR